MKQNINIEAEGNELILKNKAGDYVIIPKKYRLEVQDMIKENCHGCIDKLVETLPVMEDYAQDGSLYPEEPSINPNNPIKLPEVTITAEAPTYIKYRRAWAKENPFDIDKYVEDRFNNPVGREAIKRINEKAWRENLRQEGLKKRQAELGEATKMGLLYQRFNPQGRDDISIADEQFQKRYGTSPHRYRYDNDAEYRKYYEQQARNATSKIDYPSTDLRRKDVIAPNNMWMYPNLTGETKKAMTDFSNEVIETALPIPGLDAMGKIPSVFKAGKNLIKPVSKVIGKTDDVVKAGSKVLNKTDDVVKAGSKVVDKVDDITKVGSKVLSKTDDVVKPAISIADDVTKQTYKTTWQLEELPGLHLKSTMTDGAISKIVEPKTGLVNTEQALAIIGKESGGADKVKLIKEALGDNVPLKMDFNEFRKMTQDQLIPLERQFATHSSNYGIDRLGYKPKYREGYNYIDNYDEFATQRIKEFKTETGQVTPGVYTLKERENFIKELKENIADFKQGQKYKPLENQTLILGNKSKFGRGSSAHGNPEETLGHIHFLRDAETPDVLTVTQIQSDAFQGTHRIMPDKSKQVPEFFKQRQEQQIQNLKKSLEEEKAILNKYKTNKVDDAGYPIHKSQIDQIEESVKRKEQDILFKNADLKNLPQKQLLDKNHQERYLQELVDYAGKRGDVNKVRVPTSETAAKVQGYKQRDYDIVFRELEDLRKGNISDVTKLSSETKNVITSQGNTSLVDISETTFTPRNYKDVLSDLDKNKDFARFLENKKGIEGYEPEHQTILKKYSEQPKLIKKLFGVEPKTVTDSKGNTWYEFDIPKKFKEGKGEIKAFTAIGAIGTGVGIQSQNQNKNE
jgi:hypothetical protein